MPRLLLLALIAALTPQIGLAIDPSTAWKQSDLTEKSMRMLTKQQCMAKTITSLKSGCSDEVCLKTLAGISGDCTTWASGSVMEFCESFDNDYLAKYCWTNELDARSCMFLSLGKSETCKAAAQRGR